MYAQYQKARHPVVGGFIDRRVALAHVIDVPVNVQARITWEHGLLCLPPAEPLTEEDKRRYNKTTEKMANPTRHLNKIGFDEALDNLTEALINYFNALTPGPPHRMINMVRDYHKTSKM